jgi:hypothetical protein
VKTSLPSIALSLSAVALAGVVGWISLRPKPAATSIPSDVAQRVQEETTFVLAGSGGSASVAAADFDWASLASTNLYEYRDRLRQFTCPEPTVRDILLAEVNRLFAPREAAFKEVLTPPTPPWVFATTNLARRADRTAERAAAKADYQRRRGLRLVENEKAALVKDLLGIDLALAPLHGWRTRNYDRFEAAIDGVPAEKREQVRMIQEAYWELSDTLADEREAKGGRRDAEFVARYKDNNERRQLALQQVLSPDELDTFQMRMSAVADRLGRNLNLFQPTETEFREIYRMRREIEEPFGGTLTAANTEGFRPNPGAETEFNQKLETLLGPERLAQYRESTDPRRQTIESLRTRFNLTDEQVAQAWEIARQPVVFDTAVADGDGRIEGEASGVPTRPPRWDELSTVLGPDAFAVIEAQIAPENPPEVTRRRRVNGRNVDGGGPARPRPGR